MASTRLTRSITGSNAKKATLSFWVKRSKLGGSAYVLFTNRIDASNDTLVRFTSDLIDFKDYQSGSNAARLETSQRFRDIGAWYHVVISIDTTLGTADDRQKMYINGEQITSFQSRTNYAQDTVLNINKTGTMEIGANNSADYFDGLMSYFAFVDGAAYDPSYFGETDSSSGIWKIKTGPSVTYGTNGFFLKMDTSSPGTDTSGNTNTFTASGTPTLAQDNASNNLATFNPLDQPNISQLSVYTNGNTVAEGTDAGYVSGVSTIAPSTGKYYTEFKIVTGYVDSYVGVIATPVSLLGNTRNVDTGSSPYVNNIYSITPGGAKYSAGTGVGGFAGTFTNGDIIGIGLDCDNLRLYFSKNGQWTNGSGSYNSATPSGYITLPSGQSWHFIGGDDTSSAYATWAANFGNGFFGTTAVASSNADAAGHGLFEYAVPTGFFTLNTKNLNTYG